MGWIHDTGYSPAHQHDGHPASVLDNGTDTSESSSRVEPHVVGWRAACECGWRGREFYSRAEWPSPHGLAPDAVDGWETNTATFAEWASHLYEALPGLAVHDLARDVIQARDKLAAAVRAARAVGTPWSVIATAAGTTRVRAQEIWGVGTGRPSPGPPVIPTRGPATSDRR